MCIMDLSVGLLSVLAVVGYNFASKKPTEHPKRYTISPNDIPNGETVYESKDYKKAKNEERSKLSEFYSQSKDIKNTNKYTVVSNVKSNSRDNAKSVRFEDEQVPIVVDNSKQAFSGPMFNMAMRYYVEPEDAEFNKKENFENVSRLTDGRADYSHDNMVPFFGGHPNTVMNNNSATILSRHNGELKPAKTESFKTVNPAENIYGHHFERDLSKYVTSNKMTNLLPFEQKKIAPIPEELVRPVSKTIDELRTKNNPRSSFKAKINHGALESRLGFIGKFTKKRPETYYKNSPNKYLTNAPSSTLKQPVANYKEAFRDTTNKQAMEQDYSLRAVQNQRLGPVVRLSKTDDGKSTIYGGDTRNTLANDWVRNHTNDISLRDEKTQETYFLPEQERESTNRLELIGLKGDEAMYKGLEDTPKITNKQNTLYTYTGNMESPSIHLPESREQYYNAELITKPSRSYVPGGTHAKGVGPEHVNVQLSNKVYPEEYIGIHDSINSAITHSDLLGKTTYKYSSSEHDFSSRIIPSIV